MMGMTEPGCRGCKPAGRRGGWAGEAPAREARRGESEGARAGGKRTLAATERRARQRDGRRRARENVTGDAGRAGGSVTRRRELSPPKTELRRAAGELAAMCGARETRGRVGVSDFLGGPTGDGVARRRTGRGRTNGSRRASRERMKERFARSGAAARTLPARTAIFIFARHATAVTWRGGTCRAREGVSAARRLLATTADERQRFACKRRDARRAGRVRRARGQSREPERPCLRRRSRWFSPSS